MDIRDAYARAESFLSWNISKLYFGAWVKPVWIGGGSRFWYRIARHGRAEFVLVDPVARTKRPAFDHARLAAELTSRSGKPCDPNDLPFASITFADGGTAIRFAAMGRHWRFCLRSSALTEIEAADGPLPGELLSPDGRLAAFVRDHNLHARDTRTGEVTALTSAGVSWHGYSCPTDYVRALSSIAGTGLPAPPIALWAPDSRRLLTQRLDERRVGELHLICSIPPDGSPRPTLRSYRWPMAGDEEIGEEELVVIDVAARTCIPVRVPRIQLNLIDLSIGGGRAWWGKDSGRAYAIILERGFKTARMYEIDAITGCARTILEESCRTYLNPSLLTWPSQASPVLEARSEFLWRSERDGWAHLYLYDGTSGSLERQVTSGPWAVRDVLRVDSGRRLVYFRAGGREQGRDPYLRHLYRVGLDGEAPELLTPEDADHEISMAPDGAYFVDHHSRTDSPPASVLRSSDGELLLTLERSDLNGLMETGWRYPERFSAKARDSVTDIYGLVCRPTSYDRAKRYPVIDVTYPGPFGTRTPTTFPVDTVEGGYFWDLQAMAELGFIVVTIDGLGTPFRSRAIREHSYGRIEDCGLEDHIAALWQLAHCDPAMDLDRVGIIGHSAGGYAAARAILVHPEFYKVAVSSAGNQDCRAYLPFLLERWQGYPPDESYARQSNLAVAANLEGHLLIVLSDMDAVVHPAHAMLLVDALVKASKDFDLVILPNRTHQYYRDVYMLRRVWDYFTTHLLGLEPPRGYQIRAAPEEGEHA